MAYAIIYLIGALLCYLLWFSKFECSKFEKVWYAVFWIVILPLKVIHWLHNKW